MGLQEGTAAATASFSQWKASIPKDPPPPAADEPAA